MGNTPAAQVQRIHTLDEIRGLAVLCMVLYHGFYLLGDMFSVEAGNILFDFFMPVEPFFAGIFIFISGISSRLSHSNVVRGLRLLAISVGMSLVTIYLAPLVGIEGAEIYFGILHFLSCAMLIFSLLRPVLDRIPPAAGFTACAVLYAFTYGICNGTMNYGELFVLNIPEKLYETKFLFPLGICNPEFYSADFFPIFPHIFLFLAGTVAGTYAVKGRFPKEMYKMRCPTFAWLGRHALIIYLSHVPVLYGIFYLIMLAAGKL